MGGTASTETVVDKLLPQSAEGRLLADKYELTRLLGQGGMGAVYAARNTMTAKRCAVKMLISPELAHRPAMVARFFREAKASSIGESEHIVQVFDCGTDSDTGFPYMVMELLDGEDLETLIRRLGAIRPSTALKLVAQAALGLARAHEAGIVHRDIKPANLFLTRRDSGERVVKVLDFGIAKMRIDVYGDTAQELTQTGSLLGTPMYMSPEQAQGAKSIDARADVWSLGVVLYELLSGQRPWGNPASIGDLMVRIITKDVPLLQERAPWITSDLAELTHRAMSRDLELRFENAEQLRKGLAALFSGPPTLHDEDLAPISNEQRAEIAEALAPTAMMLRATSAAVATEPDTRDRPLRRRARTLWGLGAGFAMISAGIVWSYGKARPSTSLDASSVPIGVPSAEGKEALQKSFELRIEPSDAIVTVNDEPAAVNDGRVPIRGRSGQQFVVRLSHGGATITRNVAITDEGLIPPLIALAEKLGSPEAGATSEPRGSAARNYAKAQASKPAPSVAKDAKAPQPEQPTKPTEPREVKTSLDEFGGE